ncbi:MAG TPA: TolC family protein [Rickettsiales bacterium]|nr:TolC family protein [Rickettsiales bacterium]
MSYKNLLLSSIISLILIFSFNNSSAQQENEIEYEKVVDAQNKLIAKNKTITFKQILENTFVNNDSINAEREKTKAVESQKLKVLGANALPNIGAEVGYGQTDFKQRMAITTLKDTGSTNYNKIYLQEPIFKSGRTVAQLNMINSQIDMQRNKLSQVEQQVVFDAISITIDMLQAKEILDLTIKNEESLKSNYEYALARRKVGRTTITDLYLAKARYNSAKTDTISARTKFLDAESNFLRITKIDPKLINVNLETIFNNCFNYDLLFDTVVETALLKNPGYQMAKDNYNMNKSNLNYAKTKFLPELYLNAQIQNSDNTDLISSRDASIGLNLKIPLFQSGTEYASHREAGHLLNESKFTLNDVKDVLLNKCFGMFDDFFSSKSAVMSSKTYRDSAKIALKNTIVEEGIGKATLVDVLDRRKEYFNTEISYLKYKTTVIKSYYSLKLIMGELNLTDLFNY